jgi:hypothetical protein
MSDHAVLSDLYHETFRRFGTAYLWSKAPVSPVTPGGAAAVARTLKREGDREARILAGRIEDLCRRIEGSEGMEHAADTASDAHASAPRR